MGLHSTRARSKTRDIPAAEFERCVWAFCLLTLATVPLAGKLGETPIDDAPMLVRHILVELSSIAASLAGFVESRDGPDVDDAQLVLASFPWPRSILAPSRHTVRPLPT
jgi:hypothetical protein